jgi:hypothetical protein
MFVDELTKLREGCRRLEQDWFAAQAQIVKLTGELREAKAQIKELNKGLAGQQKLGSDCQHCIFRLEMQKRIEEG